MKRKQRKRREKQAPENPAENSGKGKDQAPGHSLASEPLYSINALSEELRVDRRTLKKHLSAIEPAGFDGRSKLYRLDEAKAILVGLEVARDTKERFAVLREKQLEEQIREATARADLLEFERAEKARDLVPLAEIQALISEAFAPIRQRFLAAPAELCNRVNPTDPNFARAAIDVWVTESLRLIRSQLPAAKIKPERR